MKRLNLKPLSLNQAYRGRRFKTKELEDYKRAIWAILPRRSKLKGKLAVRYIFGVSSKGADADNLIKILQDALAEAYNFNDNQIYKWEVEKVITKKGKEYIEFEISMI
jgi:Holliday junction resolvase RusA-like endonuclease